MILRQLPAMLAVSSSRVARPLFLAIPPTGSLNEELISRDWSFQPQGNLGSRQRKPQQIPQRRACAAR